MHDEPWRADAACSAPGLDPSLWFSTDPADVAAARLICLACPALLPCAEYGRFEPYGVWGATTPEQRAAAGDLHPEFRVCPWCRQPLHPDDPATIHPACDRAQVAAARRQTRQSVSAGRACARCDVALWPQSRSCLVCGHIVGDPLPQRPWPWKDQPA